MFRDKRFNIEHVNVQLDWGGFGDAIAAIVAVKYMKENVPNLVMHLWVPDYFFDLAKNLVPGIIVKPFSRKNEWRANWATLRMSHPQHTPLATHLVDFAFNVLVDKQIDIEYKNYCKLNTDKISIKKFTLPEKYIVLTTGFTAEVRELYPNVINDIIKYTKSKGYEVVLLGNENTKTGSGENIKGNFNQSINYSETINLLNQTNLLEAGKIISQAKCIVGLDNGLLHLAGCTDIPIIAGFSTVDPKHRLPYRNNELGWNCYTVVPNEDLPCRFCQSKFVHVYDHDFRFCFYRDKMCLSQMTSNKYINHLEKIL